MTSSFKKKEVILLFSETFKNDEILRFEILKFSSEKPPLVSQHFETRGGFSLELVLITGF